MTKCVEWLQHWVWTSKTFDHIKLQKSQCLAMPHPLPHWDCTIHPRIFLHVVHFGTHFRNSVKVNMLFWVTFMRSYDIPQNYPARSSLWFTFRNSVKVNMLFWVSLHFHLFLVPHTYPTISFATVWNSLPRPTCLLISRSHLSMSFTRVTFPSMPKEDSSNFVAQVAYIFVNLDNKKRSFQFFFFHFVVQVYTHVLLLPHQFDRVSSYPLEQLVNDGSIHVIPYCTLEVILQD